MKQTDTIAAISTAVSNSGIGVIRISGTDAISIADKCFVSKSENFKLINAKANTIHYGFISDANEIIDEVLVFVFKAPHSFTSEDTIEISCHGGAFVMQQILQLVLRCGARLAEPGEFTKRAFLSGRIDLSQAESIMDLINSENELILKNSVNQLRGSLYNEIKDLRNIILHETAFIEAAIDDPEHYSLDNYSEKLDIIIDELLNKLNKLYDNADNGIILKEGINTVIIGKPNAGKSSLLNLLAGKERAIVTDIAGTTRDTLSENINLDGIVLKVTDTAGIRNTSDPIEKIGVELAKNAVKEADLVIYVLDSSVPLDENDNIILDIIGEKKSIVLLNKCDKPNLIDKEKLNKELIYINFSAKNGEGLDLLKDTIINLFFKGNISYNNEVFLTNVRQKNLIKETINSLSMVKESIANCMSEDFYSIDLYDAYASLGFIIGENVSDDLIDKIFSDFCMGK